MGVRVRARVYRSRGWWVAEVPALPALHTQARALADIPSAVVDAGSALGVRINAVRIVSGRRRP
ncbi:transcriptional regulator [Microbacterium sp. Gd 4-13]|nr:transcriptional regulator [Microbacterium sp. Gd 4-13]